MTPLRTFIAIELDDALIRDLTKLRTRIDAGGSGVRWMSAGQMHLTLKFLGDLDERRLPELCHALTGIAATHDPFDMRLAGAGCFPPRGPLRIVWAGFEESTGRLASAGQSKALAQGRLAMSSEVILSGDALRSTFRGRFRVSDQTASTERAQLSPNCCCHPNDP